MTIDLIVITGVVGKLRVDKFLNEKFFVFN